MKSPRQDTAGGAGVAVGYVRYHQDAGPVRREQKKAISKYKKKQRLRFWRHFVEEVVPQEGTGATWRELRKLLSRVDKRQIRWVLVDCVDRLGETPAVRVELIRMIKRRKVKLIETSTCRELTRDPELQRLCEGLSVEDRERAYNELAEFRKSMRTPSGPKAYGVSREEEPILRRIIALAGVLPKNQHRRLGRRVLWRRSFRQIAAILNAEGVRPRNADHWTGPTVQGILRKRRPRFLERWFHPNPKHR